MDTALQLRMDVDSGIVLPRHEALQKLQQSELVHQLTNELVEKPLFYIWRIIALSEIPHAQHLDYTKNLIDRIFEKLSTPFGFSLSGDEKNFLPCYNAMVISALCRLGHANNPQVLNAVEWINNHQPVERGKTVVIPNLKFDRFGGCFKNTPCYIGLAKSVFALFDYQKETGDTNVSPKLEQGKEYLLQHHLIKRLNSDKPITQHILDISFPESYNLNIVELIRFAGNVNILNDPRTKYAVEYLQDKKGKDKAWRVNYRYKSQGYMVFDKTHKAADWTSHIINHALNSRNGY